MEMEINPSMCFFDLLITGHIRNLIINGEDVLRNFGYLCVGRV